MIAGISDMEDIVRTRILKRTENQRDNIAEGSQVQKSIIEGLKVNQIELVQPKPTDDISKKLKY